MQKRALVSVYDKTGVADFARGLVELGYEVVSTGGTYKALQAAGIPVTYVSDVTGFPEILSGRVKTLHPRIHAGILARRDEPAHMDELASHNIAPIDVVAVNLYPFAATVAKPGVTLAEALENIDIGGPTMIRAAAKNYPGVVVVVNPLRYETVLAALKTGEVSQSLRLELAREAFAHTAQYDRAIEQYLGGLSANQEASKFPAVLELKFTQIQSLRYGENWHQAAAFYRDEQWRGGATLATARQLHGKELSFNNLNDASAALEMVLEFSEPAVAAVKHTNPCGLAVAESISAAYRRAYEADPRSIFGGIVACNRPVDLETAEMMSQIFLEVVIAPGYEPEALAVLTRKAGIRLLEMPMERRTSWIDMKRIPGGLLLQEADVIDLDRSQLKTVTKREPTAAEWQDLLFSWTVVKHVKSNAIVLASDRCTVGVGAGQMNRIQAAEIAIAEAGDRARGSCMGSDAFFPFPDVVEAAAKAGVTAIIQPGGSKNDAASVAAADAAGIAMVFTGIRHFKH